MSRSKEIEDEIRQGFLEIKEEAGLAKAEKENAAFEEEFKEMNGIPFIWGGRTDEAYGDETLRRAFNFAGKKDFLEKYEDWGVLEWFYISDVSALDDGDRRALANKYEDGRRFLQKGNQYYLNKI